MAKSKKKIQARQLRRVGESIKAIAKNLHVSVSSVSLWCRDIILTKDQWEKLDKRRTDPLYGNKLQYLNLRKTIFEKKIHEIKEQGIKEIGVLRKRDILLIGVALYWGEGFKKDHLVGFATSDPSMAQFFVFWLKECFFIDKTNLIFRVTANISYKKEINLLMEFWSKKLGVDVASFSKPYFQKTKWKKEYENKDDYHGVIRIRVRRSINLLRKIFGYIEGVSRFIEKTH